eukprot:2291703-Rhodomonas_salina.2
MDALLNDEVFAIVPVPNPDYLRGCVRVFRRARFCDQGMDKAVLTSPSWAASRASSILLYLSGTSSLRCARLTVPFICIVRDTSRGLARSLMALWSKSYACSSGACRPTELLGAPPLRHGHSPIPVDAFVHPARSRDSKQPILLQSTQS